jgi:SAM-dependent methyltransferase
MKLSNLYENRFDERAKTRKNSVWHVLCTTFFQRYIAPEASVLDVGAGFCEFINHISCAEKYAFDLNEKTATHASPDVHVIVGSNLSSLEDGRFDVVFMSNFLEHMKSKEEVLQVLTEARRLLKENGRILVLQPNIRYAYKQYWDFFDHHVPLSDKSLAEGLQLAGFSVEVMIPRFVPFTTRSRLPQHPVMVKAYLRCPFVWRFLGKQAFAVGKKSTAQA